MTTESPCTRQLLRQREHECNELSSAFEEVEQENKAAVREGATMKQQLDETRVALSALQLKSQAEKDTLVDKLQRCELELKRERHARLLLSHNAPDEAAGITGLLSIIAGLSPKP